LGCATCHGYPPAPTSLSPAAYGTMNNWSSARIEDYPSGGGAHIVAGHVPKTAKPSDGWVNCIPCHNGGPASHAKTVTADGHFGPATVTIDPQYSFTTGGVPAYDAVGKTCSNVSCHSVPAGTFSYYFPGGDGNPLLNTVPFGGISHQTPVWTTTGAQCIACHDNPPYSAPNQYVWHSGWHGGVNLISSSNPDVLGYNKCDLCHSDVISTITGTPGTATAQMTTTITDINKHRNGVADVQGKFEQRCFGCH
jgi:trimeric autotransporter adhesin